MRNFIIKIVIILLSCSILLGTFICIDVVFRGSSFTNKIISRIENKAKCKTMNGWWAVSGSSDMTITAPKIHWGDLNGTIELYRDQEISNKFTTLFVLSFKIEKDGYSKTIKCYIGTPNNPAEYEYYLYNDEQPDSGAPIYRIND